MKLASCSTDVRKLKFYINELISIDDLFTLSYDTTLDLQIILGNPNNNGWITGSHILILY